MSRVTTLQERSEIMRLAQSGNSDRATTRLHLWLLAPGLQLQFGRMAQPRDQAMTERSHQLWNTPCLHQVSIDLKHKIEPPRRKVRPKFGQLLSKT